MTSSNGNIFRVTGPLCGEFTGPGEFPTQRPVTRSFDVSFDLRLNTRLSKQPWGWWFETLSWSLWRQCNVNFPQDIYQRNGDSRSCALYKVYGVDKLTDNWNSSKKESTRPKLTLYLQSVENMVTYIFWWLAIIVMSKVLFNTFFDWESSNIKAHILVSVYSVRKAWNRFDGVVPRQSQHFVQCCYSETCL